MKMKPLTANELAEWLEEARLDMYQLQRTQNLPQDHIDGYLRGLRVALQCAQMIEKPEEFVKKEVA